MLHKLKPVVIITCVDYFDFLNVTLPHTLKFASHVYVYTTPGNGSVDLPGVTVVETRAFFHRGATFNKAAAIHEAQRKVHADHPLDWILLLDADIACPPDICHEVECRSTLYGIQRKDYETPADYAEGRFEVYHSPGAGYFQLYWDKSKYYPESSEDASVCDITFYTRFSRKHMCEGYVHHLGQHTVNWNGRVAPAWTA